MGYTIENEYLIKWLWMSKSVAKQCFLIEDEDLIG